MCYKNMLTTNCVHLNCLLTQYVGIFNYILTKEYIMRWMWKGFICFFIQCTLSPFDLFFLLFFSVRLLSVLRRHLVFSSPLQRPMTSDFEGFSIPDFIHYICFFYLNSWERASIFPFECSVLNKGTTGTIFITSLVCRSPCLALNIQKGKYWLFLKN